jgi:hypothetical protein
LRRRREGGREGGKERGRARLLRRGGRWRSISRVYMRREGA